METVNIAGLLCRECVSKSQCYCLKDYDKQRELCSLNNSLMQSGFVQIVGHGVKSSLISDFFREAKSFFAAIIRRFLIDHVAFLFSSKTICLPFYETKLLILK